MISSLRRLFGWAQSTPSASPPGFDPQQFMYVMIPDDIQPLARGERFEDPLEAVLQAARLGSISGGGSQLDDPYPDGRPRVAFCGIDIDVVDLDRALGAIRRKLGELDAPEGTEVHYTVGETMLLDRLANGVWHQRLPRSLKHPEFGV